MTLLFELALSSPSFSIKAAQFIRLFECFLGFPKIFTGAIDVECQH
jgi:hypothetical protein